MSILINETGGGALVQTKNTGGAKQNTPKPIRKYALARKDFDFATLALSRSKAAWDTAKEAKDIVVFWDVNEPPAQNNTEATKKEGRFKNYPLKDGVRGLKLIHYVDDDAYAALKTYDDSSEYTRMFRILTDGNYTCDIQDDESVKGELLSNFSVGVLNDTTDETPQNCEVDIKFSGDTKSVLQPDFDLETYEGIYDVRFTIVSASATEIVVQADSDGAVTSLVQANWKFTEGGGADEPITGSSPNATAGEYTLTGAAFVTGTLSLDGVVTQSDVMYEGISKAVTI